MHIRGIVRFWLPIGMFLVFLLSTVVGALTNPLLELSTFFGGMIVLLVCAFVLWRRQGGSWQSIAGVFLFGLALAIIVVASINVIY